MSKSLAQEFIEFIDEAPGRSAKSLATRVLLKCRLLTDAEAGTIYVVRGKGTKRQLQAMSLQNDAVRTKSQLFIVPVDPGSIAGYVASTRETVLVDDVYQLCSDVPYSFNPTYDRQTGYVTRSILAFPLATPEGQVIGVVQLINRLGPETGGKRPAIPFDRDSLALIAPVSATVGRAVERTLALEAIAERNKRLTNRNAELREERARVVALQAETERAFMMSVQFLARAAELHDENTGEHVKRVNEYSYVLATLAKQPQAYCDEIRWAAALHDVGKMSVDKEVLHKKGRLDEREWREMKAHAEYGHVVLQGFPRLNMAAEIAHCHHEMWAGGGYPRGLKGEEIPLSARIVAIADVYDALRSWRPYKVGFSHERSVEIILKGDDRLKPADHFDPHLLALFARHHHLFAEVWDRLGQSPPPAEAA